MEFETELECHWYMWITRNLWVGGFQFIFISWRFSRPGINLSLEMTQSDTRELGDRAGGMTEQVGVLLLAMQMLWKLQLKVDDNQI